MLKLALLATAVAAASTVAAEVTVGPSGPGSTDYPHRSLVEIGTVDFPKPEDGFTAMAYDERLGHVYALHFDGVLSVVKFAAGPTDRTLRRIGSVEIGTEPSDSIIADPNNQFSLIVTATEVIKIRHEDGNTMPRVVGRTALRSDESQLSPGIFDREGRFAYFSTVGGPLYLVQIDAGTGDDPPRRITRVAVANTQGGIDSIATDANRRLAFLVADSGEPGSARLVTIRLASPTAPMAFVANVSLPTVSAPASLSYHVAGTRANLLVFSPGATDQYVRQFDVNFPPTPIARATFEIEPDPERLVPLPRGRDTHARFAAVAEGRTFLLRIRPADPTSGITSQVLAGPTIEGFGAAVGGSVVFGDSDFILLGDEIAGGDLVRLAYTEPFSLEVIATGNGAQPSERLGGLALNPTDGSITVGGGTSSGTVSAIHQVTPSPTGGTWRGSAGTGQGRSIALHRDPDTGALAHVVSWFSQTEVVRAAADATAGGLVQFDRVGGVSVGTALDSTRDLLYLLLSNGTDELGTTIRYPWPIVGLEQPPQARSTGEPQVWPGPYLAVLDEALDIAFFATHKTLNRMVIQNLAVREEIAHEEIREFAGPDADGPPRLGFIDREGGQLVTIHQSDAFRLARWALNGVEPPTRLDATEIPGITAVSAISWDADSREVLLAGTGASGAVASRMALPLDGPPAPTAPIPLGDAAAETHSLLLDADRDSLWVTQNVTATSPSLSFAELRRFDTGRIDGAVWGTRVTVGQPLAVDEVSFFSHAAGANVRLAVYDDADPRALLWESAAIPTVAGASVIAPIANGATTTALRLAPGDYWLAWQLDRDIDAPGYLTGGTGTGLRLEQPFGAMPATIGDEARTTPDNWSISLRGTESGDAVMWMMR